MVVATRAKLKPQDNPFQSSISIRCGIADPGNSRWFIDQQLKRVAAFSLALFVSIATFPPTSAAQTPTCVEGIPGIPCPGGDDGGGSGGSGDDGGGGSGDGGSSGDSGGSGSGGSGDGGGGSGGSGSGDGGGGGGITVDLREYVVAAICANMSAPTSECLRQEQRGIALMVSTHIIKIYVNAVAERPLLLTFPALISPAAAARFLLEAEMTAIEVVQDKLVHDLTIVREIPWATEEQKRRALRIIHRDEIIVANWNKRAREVARAGINWSLIKVDNSTKGYKFRPGRAYQKLRDIESFGWLQE